jgi:serine/threonine protein kinase
MADRIGRFEIQSEISRSQSACIYKATDPENGQTVALKTVRLDLFGDQAAAVLQAVLEEADTTKPLNSPNIAALYGAGDIDGHFCAAMEYVQGKSIASILAKREGFSVWDLQDIARQACQALDHAHARQVVHYTLEPGKIMVAWDGTVKILSFGVSIVNAGVARATGPAPDSLHYMSPEQVRGESLDARSNLFSLGAILYEMVTGRKAFTGDDADQLRQEIAVGMPVAPAQIIPKIHPGISELIMKALAKTPGQRYQSGQDLIADLEQCKENVPKAPARKNPAAPPAPEVRRNVEENAPAIARKAAAAAGWGGSQPQATSSPASAEMSATLAPEKEVEAPAPSDGNGNRNRSFSDVTSLPPLAEHFVPPPAARPAEPEPERPSAEPLPQSVFRGSLESEKPKTPPSELAKRAISELRKTPPKLVLISLAGAAAIILLVIALIYAHVRSENAEENAPAAQTSQNAVPEPAQPAPAVPHISRAQDENSSEPANGKRSVISVAPKSAKKKTGKVFTPPAPVVVPGQLTINSTPEGAQVLVDGHHDPAWLTPLNVTGLAPGQHLVSVSKAGYSPQSKTIDVTAGSKSFLALQLSQLGATAFVSSVPPGAELFIDGHDTGKTTPVEMPVEKPGAHTFLVKKQGYLDETSSANLQPGQAFQFAPVLQALASADDIKIGGGRFKKIFGGGDTAGMGSVTVKTQPKGAQIAINRRVLDKASPVEFFLNPGTYILDITLSGYGNIHRVISVERSGKLAIDETLQRQ